MSARAENDAKDMLAILAGAPDGITMPDMCEQLDWPIWRGHRAKTLIRRVCAETDTINLVCEPAGFGPWLYLLVGTLEDATTWVTIRLHDTESRLATMQNVMASLVRASDGRSTDGRKARMLERTFRHLIEDLEALTSDGAA